MKQSKYLFLVLLIILTISSCKKDFLEVKDNSSLNRQSYVKDLNSMQDFLNGIYVMLTIYYEGYFNEAYPGLISDELKVSGETVDLALHNNWSQVTDTKTTGISTSMNKTWMECYQIIRACNFVIEDVDKFKSEAINKIENIKGQAYAIRALVHFKLVNIFAQTYKFTTNADHPGIPYITTSDVTKPYSRQTVAEVYTNLISDLQSAISLLPADIGDCRIMNSQAAKALLARVYLFKEDYNAAKKLSIELIKKTPLMTISAGYPIDIVKNKIPAETEVFFQVVPIQKGVSSTYVAIYMLFDYYRATTDLANILKENTNDIRNTWVSGSGANWMVTKFPQGVAGGLGYHPSIDYYPPILRSSEMYLAAAEACAKTNNEDSARFYLDVIRKRADPIIAGITATGEALIDSIYKERRKELCFEGFRMWDLQRRKLGVHRADVLPGYQTTLPYPSDKAIAPIPGQDVNLMGLQQNASYN